MKQIQFGIMYDKVLPCGFDKCPNMHFIDRADAEVKLNQVFGID